VSTAPTGASARPALSDSRHPSLWTRTPYRADDWFDAATLAEARAYARPVNRMRLIRGAVGLAAIAAFVGFEAGPRLVEGLGLRGWALQLVAVLAAFTVLTALAAVVFDAWLSLRHDKRHGLSNETPASFAADTVKELVLSLVLLVVLLVPVHLAIRATEAWWVLGWAITATLTTVLALAYPVLIMPRFNRFDPLAPGDLLDRIRAVADRAGEEVEGVYVMDASKRTTRDNAFVAGWGPTKRVVLFDTLLEHPPEVIEQIVAHEIGHYRLRHIPKTIAVQAVVLLAVFAFLGWFTTWDPALRFAGIEAIDDPAGIALLLVGLGIGFTVTSFVSAFHSRAKERQADLEALELLGRPDHFLELWRRLAPKNRSELEPSAWRRLQASHPDVAERMAFGARWAELNPTSPGS
jgi:STE24 endopeptidase